MLAVPLAPSEELLVLSMLVPLLLVAPFGTRLPWVALPWPEVVELPVFAEGEPGLVLLVALVELVVLCVAVVSVLGDFLLLFMSPSASAEPLVRATMDVRMNAGASLRIWASLCWMSVESANLQEHLLASAVPRH